MKAIIRFITLLILFALTIILLLAWEVFEALAWLYRCLEFEKRKKPLVAEAEASSRGTTIPTRRRGGN